VAGHWITNGLGGSKILNRVLQNLNHCRAHIYEWGEEVVRLSVPSFIATGHRVVRDGEIVQLPEEDVRRSQKVFTENFVQTQPFFTQPPGQQVQLRTSPDVIEELRLSESDSTALLRSCREHGVTVTALLNILYAMAYVKDPQALSGFKTVALSGSPVNNHGNLLHQYKDSIGRQLTVSPMVFDSRLVQACLDANSFHEAIWEAAEVARKQMVDVSVSIYHFDTYHHSLIE
jgi:hypothetical protein